MESSLPFALRVAAGLVSESLDAVRRLPADISTLPVTVIGKVAKLSFQLNQELTDLATAGDRLIATLHSEEPPERTPWSTIDDDDDPAVGDSAAADTASDKIPPADEPAVTDVRTVVIDDEVPGVVSTTEALDHPLIEDVATLAAIEQLVERSVEQSAEPSSDETPVVTAKPAKTARPRARLVGLPSTDLPDGSDDAATGISSLTIAQLRSRVRSMSAEQVQAALSDEQTGKARPAFLTVLTNRLSTLSRGGE